MLWDLRVEYLDLGDVGIVDRSLELYVVGLLGLCWWFGSAGPVGGQTRLSCL